MNAPTHYARIDSDGEAELEVSEDPADHAGRWWHQNDLDKFVSSIYELYDAKGFGNIVTKGVLDHLNIVFVLAVVLFLAVVLDFRDLNHRLDHPCPDAVDLMSVDCHGTIPIDFGRMGRISWLGLGIIFFFLAGWATSFVWFLSGVPHLRQIRDFYEHELKISHRELQTIRWDMVVDELSRAQRRLQLCTTTDSFDKLDISNLIARRKNFLIAMYGELAQKLEVAIPFVGPRMIMSHSLQWNLEKILFRVIVFDGDAVVPEVWSDPDRVARQLQKYFKLYGLINLLLAPCILLFQLAFFVFHNSDSFRKSAGPLSTRQWSPYACWMMRNYSETEHAFRKRLQRSYKPATKYVSLFVSEMTTIWARFLVFVFGGMFVVLTVLGFIYDEDFLFAYLTPDRSVIWWTGIIGAALALSQSLIPAEAQADMPDELLNEVKGHTNFFRDSWAGREETLDTFDDFTLLYQLKGVNFLEELASILVTPYLLMVRLPNESKEIVEFFQRCSYKHPYLPGHFCKYAYFRNTPEESIELERAMLEMQAPGPGPAPAPRGDMAIMASFAMARSDGGPAMAGSASASAMTMSKGATSKMGYSVAAFNMEHPGWRPTEQAGFGSQSSSVRHSFAAEPAQQHQQRGDREEREDRVGIGTGRTGDTLLQPLISPS